MCVAGTPIAQSPTSQTSDGVRAKPGGAFSLTELDHGISLNLPHALARKSEQFSDLIERSRSPVV
jgi:hypothetical protein